MQKRIRICLVCFGFFTFAALAVPPEVSNVRAAQRDGTKLVDIWYDVADADGDGLIVEMDVSCDAGKTWNVPAFALSGDIGKDVSPGSDKHVVWDAGQDWDGEYSDSMRVKVSASDVSGPPGISWSEEILPGGFLLGQDGGAEGTGPSKRVVVPWPYWLSAFEITVGQYRDFLNTALACGKIRRERRVGVWSEADSGLIDGIAGSSYLLPIGTDCDIYWNVDRFEVVEGRENLPVRVTWYGAMAFANFYGCDLPTSAEWEKAARGPDHAAARRHFVYPWGNAIGHDQARYGSPDFADVGSFGADGGSASIKGYGLCDMIGNAAEWTRTDISNDDIEDYPATEDLSDPIHDVCNATASVRGGAFDSDVGDLAIWKFKNVTKIVYGESEETSTEEEELTSVCNETIGNVSTTPRFSGQLDVFPIQPGSLIVFFDNGMFFSDDGKGRLVGNVDGSGGNVVYDTGALLLDWSASAENWQTYSGAIHGSYEYDARKVPPSVTVRNEILGMVVSPGSFCGGTRGYTIVPGSLIVALDNGLTFTDTGNCSLISNVSGTGGTVNYNTGTIVLNWFAATSDWQSYRGAVRCSYTYYQQNEHSSTRTMDVNATNDESLNGFRLCRREAVNSSPSQD